MKKNNQASHLTFSDKIDMFVTNRFLAIPIFLGVIALVFMITFGKLGSTLKDGVSLCLRYNQIWDEWVIACSNIRLKKWVLLDLSANNISWEWAKAIAEKMELKEWVKLDLSENQIWDEWAQAMLDNMKLKEWVILNLAHNAISDGMKGKLKEWARSYNAEIIFTI